MRDLPAGTVTLLFTDIEGSTRLLQAIGGEAYAEVLGEHNRLLREAIAEHRGVEVKTEGDSFFVAFRRAGDALKASVRMQRALAAAQWPADTPVKVRMGLHTGEVVVATTDYVGLDVHRAARISDAAHGGQVLLSEVTRNLVDEGLPDGVALRDMGEHRLKDLDQPEHLFQLLIDGLPADFPPIRAESTRLIVLPAETTDFIGREEELRRATELLRRTRLLTLSGPGGTGKTRLSLQLARELAGEFPDGVAFVPLAPIVDPELVGPTIRQTLGLAEEAGRTAGQTLVDGLRHRNMLLVLDNFEQILPAAALVRDLLEGTERLKVMVSSRARLRVSGEQEFAVPPLETPRPEDADDLGALSQSDAVALFMQRAQSIRPDFQLTAGNARAIVEICRRLDGLPLAIELAAARVKLLPPQALLARLGRRLDILQSGAAYGSDRQRTLRGAIDWSYELLQPDEQTLFRRLSAFVGGWTLEAGEQVVGSSPDFSLDILEGLTALVDHSLVRQDELAGEPRFTMLETIREYGLEQLAEAGEEAVVQAAHGRYFAALAAESEPFLTSGNELADRLEIEHDNLRAMLRWSVAADIRLGLATAGALWRFWHLRGHLREGSRLLAEMLVQPGAGEPTLERARALVGLAGLVYWMGDYDAARGAYQEALAIAEHTREARLRAEILYSLGYVHAIEQDWRAALDAYGQARAAYEELADERGAALSTMGSGMVSSLMDDQATAIAQLKDALARFEQLGEGFGRRNTLAVLSRALMQRGDLPAARQRNRAALESADEAHDPTSLSAALLDLAGLEASEGRLERAARLTGSAQAMVERTGGQAPPQLVNRIEPLPLLEKQLEPPVLQQLLSEGRSLPSDAAVRLALDEAV